MPWAGAGGRRQMMGHFRLTFGAQGGGLQIAVVGNDVLTHRAVYPTMTTRKQGNKEKLGDECR